MAARPWFRQMFDRAPCPQAPRPRRPRLESLEDRLVPAPALLSSWEGINMSDDAALNGAISVPPDPSGAVGTTHSVAIVNRSIEVQAKGGEPIPVRASLNNLFLTSARLFDPKVLWDRHSQRFFVVVLESDRTSTSAIRLAVSPTGNPRNLASWTKYRFNTVENIGGSNTWADYPGFAVDRDAIYITANMFTFGGNQYQDSRLWIVNKANLINGTLTQTRHAPPNRGFTMQPAQTYSHLPTGAGTFIVTWGANSLQLIRVTNPLLSNPTFTTHTLGTGNISNGPPPDAPQQGSSTLIDTGDNRMLSAVWHNGMLYATNTVNPPSGPDAGQATAHWYRIDTTNLANPVLADQGNIGGEDLAAGTHTYYPSVTVDDRGNMAVGFSGSNATVTRASAFYTARRAGHPAGYTEPIAFLRGGDDWYNITDSLGRNRWGDYSGAGLDPDGRTFYFYNEYPRTRTIFDPNGIWGTRHGNSRYETCYEIVTAGPVTTVTTDNTTNCAVRLERSATSTTINVNGVNVATTTAPTINVNGGWARNTYINVVNAAGGTYTVTSTQVVTPGLTVNFRNLAGYGMTAGISGADAVVNVNSQPDVRIDVAIRTAGGNDIIRIGNGTTPLPLTAPTTILGQTGNDRVILNDQGTTTGQTWTFENPSANLTRVLRNSVSLLTIDSSEVVEFNAGSGNDTITHTGAGAAATTLSAGGGNDVININSTAAGRTLTVNGGDGNDTIHVGGGNILNTIAGPLTVNGQGGTDTLNVNDQFYGGGSVTWTITGTAVSRNGGTNPVINYGTAEALNVNGGPGPGLSTFNVNGTHAASTVLNTGTGANSTFVRATSGPLTINGQIGVDNVTLGSLADTLAPITGPVTVTNAGTFTAITVNDQGTAAARNATLSDTSLTGMGPAINWIEANIRSLTINAGSGNDTFTVTDTPTNPFGVTTTLSSGAGDDGININRTSSALTVNGGDGADRVFLSPVAFNLDALASLVTFVGGAGADQLVARDDNYAGSEYYEVGAGYVARAGSAGFTNSEVENVTLTGGSADSLFFLLGTQPGVAVALHGGGSDNTLVGPEADTIWNLLGLNTGSLTGDVSFSGVQNLIGLSGNDYFAFADGAGLTGYLYDYGGSNTLDYSARTTGVVVNLPLGAATGVGAFLGGFQNAIGGSGDDTLVGDDASNWLDGGAGRDLLIAGGWDFQSLNPDVLLGGEGEDILIAGVTVYDFDPGLLAAISAEWSRTDLSYAERVSNLLTGAGGVPVLDASTVYSNYAGYGGSGSNTVLGGADTDFFFLDTTLDVSDWSEDEALVQIA